MVLCAAWLAAAASSGTGDYSNGNRSLFMLPRSSAVAGSDGLLSGDATPHSSPAGLALADRHQLSVSYAGFYHNTFSTSSVSFVEDLGKNDGVGISVAYLYVPSIPVTADWQVTAEGYPIRDSVHTRYSYASDVFIRAAWGHRFPLYRSLSLAAGIAVNGQRKNYVDEIGYGIGVDGSALLDIGACGLRIGADAQNLTTNYMRWNSGYKDVASPQVRVGIGFDRPIPYIYGRVKLTYMSPDFLGNEGVNTDGSLVGDSSATPKQIHPSKQPFQFVIAGSHGLEYVIADRVSLRIGASQTNYFTFGGGVSFLKRALTVDFAYLLHELAGTYQVSLTYGW